MAPKWTEHATVLLAIGLGYGLLAAGAITMTRLSGGIALLWLANAPLIGVLSMRKLDRWPPILGAAMLGSCIASLLFSPTPYAAPIFAPITVGEGALAAFLIRRWGVHRSRFDSTKSIALFVLAAGVVAPAASGIIGVALITHFLHLHFLAALFDWQLGHGIGNLIGAPLALLLTRRDIDWPAFHARKGTAKAIGAVALCALTTCLVFYQTRLPLLFLPIVPVLIGTFVFQRFGAAVGILIVATIGGTLSGVGFGPVALVHGDQAMRLQFFQFYLAILFLIALPVAATLVQRDKLFTALRESEARYRMLADNASDILLTLDIDGTIRFASPAIRELGDFEPERIVGENAVNLVHPDDRERVRAAHVEALGTPDRIVTIEYRAIKASGETGWFETRTRAVRDERGRVTAVVSIIRDLARQKHREDELVRAANTDSLTGLLNRAAFRARGEAALIAARHGQPSAIALLDLDHFKRVNDTYGHAAGDAALLMLADLLRENLRPEDAVGRLGGEEFAILFAGLPLSAATPITDRLRRLLEDRTFATDNGPATVTMSCGIAALDPDRDMDAVLRLADAALYAAKHKGRNRIEVAVTEMIS